MKLGIIGLGQFGPELAQLFYAHPGVDHLALCDVVKDRAKAVQSSLGPDTRVVDNVDDMFASDVDAVAIFTQRWLHAEMTIKALKAGKHVYCAVPMANTVAEVKQILDTVQRTGLVYMSGETCYYYPAVIYCREKWQKGDFGHFVYAEGEYRHDMSHGFYDAYKFSGGATWKETASFPPMMYPTHSVSAVLASVGSYFTKVSCIGYRDQENDGVFDRKVSKWNNDFSNESAFFTRADGGAVRINEFRRIGSHQEHAYPMSIIGTQGSFEQNTRSATFQTLNNLEDVSELLACDEGKSEKNIEASDVNAEILEGFRSGMSKLHDVKRLPAEFKGLPNGHEGSHQFLVDDFVKACVSQTVPPISAWRAARYVVPGLVAHQSALRDGERMDVPDFGPGPEVGTAVASKT